MSHTTTCSTTYLVAGMTCEHCVHAVTQEVGALPGVQQVAVDLSTGAVTVHSDRVLTDQEVSAAIDEAGYQLAS